MTFETRNKILLFMSCAILGTVISAHAQGFRISGNILEASSGHAVPDVTVYINGTSKGTTSDPGGRFELNGVRLPCELVISHVSYELKHILLRDTSGLDNFRITLDERIFRIEEVTVIHDQIKADYLRRFKAWFLGADYERYDADILNDSVLIFNILENDQFSVTATGPLIVDLPATGYTLKVDLVKFDLLHSEELQGYHCSILGYYYFVTVDAGSPRMQRTIARNRVEHFYNSSMHFCRSLYHNSLAENGYIFERECTQAELGQSGIADEPDFIAGYVTDKYGHRQLLLTDFTCRTYRITFCYNSRNRPVDLTYLDSNPSRLEGSGLQFLNDTVRIYPSGRIPENTILFSGSISRKGISSLLPEDYIPSMR